MCVKRVRLTVVAIVDASIIRQTLPDSHSSIDIKTGSKTAANDAEMHPLAFIHWNKDWGRCRRCGVVVPVVAAKPSARYIRYRVTVRSGGWVLLWSLWLRENDVLRRGRKLVPARTESPRARESGKWFRVSQMFTYCYKYAQNCHSTHPCLGQGKVTQSLKSYHAIPPTTQGLS